MNACAVKILPDGCEVCQVGVNESHYGGSFVILKNMTKYPVLITYLRTVDRGEELKYTIRTLKNIKNWDGRVFVVGDNEDWFKDIIHIPIRRTFGRAHKDRNAKLRKAIADKRLPDDFIFTNDDIYIMKPMEIDYLYSGEITTDEGFSTSKYKQIKYRTMCWLRDNKDIDKTLDYDLHTPMLLNKQKLTEVLGICEQQHPDFELHFRTLYGNIYKVGGRQIQDGKRRWDADIVSTGDSSELPFVPKLLNGGKTPTVSVVIPAYNASEYIEACLDSIPKHKAIKEIIVCDDGSSDNTLDILKSYSKRSTRILANKTNKGVGYTFNKLIDAVNADYILRVDSDDLLRPEMTKVLDLLDGETEIYYYNMVDFPTGQRRQCTPRNKRQLVANFHIYKTSLIGDTRTIETNWSEDRYFLYKLLEKNPTEVFTNIDAYGYNHPRTNSLMWIHKQKKAGNIPTVNLFTNCHKDCLTSPTIFKTFYSYIGAFGRPDDFSVYLDPNPNPNCLEAYRQMIIDELGAEPIITTGLADGWKRSLDDATTPFVLHLEADWLFQNIEHRIDEIIQMMKDDNLWFMLFNQHENRYMPELDKWQTYFKGTDKDYCLSDRFSNNPNIINIDYFKQHHMNKIDWTLPGAGRIEEVLQKTVDIAVYGKLNHQPTIKHLDMRRGGIK